MDKQEFLRRIERMADPERVRIRSDRIRALEIGELPEIGAAEPAPEAARSEMDILRFALMANSINHQFWDIGAEGFERYARNGKVGALAMFEALGEWVEKAGSIGALEAELPLTADRIAELFGGLPDPGERARALGEALGPAGRAAASRMLESLREGKVWGVELAGEISALLPSGFEDPFLKKSQLCLWMAKGMLEARGFGPARTDLTCFADYQIPKVLRGMGVLEYSEALAARVDRGELLESDGPEERAIRAATVSACEEIASEKGISPAQLDFWLWTRRNETSSLFHRSKTRRY